MSYSPPPYGGPTAKKSTNPLVWVFVAIGAFCCIAIIGFGAMGYGVYNGTKDMFPCMFTSSILGQSMRDYVKEQGKFPPADKWQTEIAPYYDKAKTKFQEEMKDAPKMIKNWGDIADIHQPVGCNTQGKKTYFVYNSEMAGKKLGDIADPDTTAMFFEDDNSPVMNAARKYEPKPFREAPRLMGSPRGWYVVLVNGETSTTDDKGKQHSVDVRTGN